MSSPLVSIITPCLNSEKTIQRTIESVLNQSYQHLQYIVIDGESSDRTLEILANYQRQDARLIVVSQKDNSMTEALNRGLRLAAGEIIASLNADDWYEEGAIAQVVHRYQNQPFDCLIGNTQVVSESEQLLHQINPWPCAWLPAWHLMGCLTPESSVFYSAHCVKAVGAFNETLKYTQDLEYYLRILETCQIAHINQVLSSFQVSTNQYSARLHDRMELEVLSYISYKWLRRLVGGTSLGSLLRVITGVRTYHWQQFWEHLIHFAAKQMKYSLQSFTN